MLIKQVVVLLACGMVLGYCTACIIDIVREPK
jgi:hypothetical protein